MQKASEEDIQATIDFLTWVITSDEGRTAINKEMGFDTPFTTFTDEYAAENVLVNAANEYVEAGKNRLHGASRPCRPRTGKTVLEALFLRMHRALANGTML